MSEVYFDHSALTRIYEAGPGRDAILTGLRQMGRIRITSANVLEAAARSDEADRMAKLEFYKTLTGELNPVDLPSDLLRATAKAFLEGSSSVKVGSDEGWTLLHQPDVLTSDLFDESSTFTQKRNADFRKSFEQMREIFEPHFAKVPSDRAADAVSLITYFCERLDTYIDILLAPSFERATGVNPGNDKVRTFIDGCDAWRLYWAGQVHAMYSRAVKNTRYGHKRNAGFVDLESAIYLSLADYFVTFDRAQYEAFNDLNAFNRRPTKILWYGDLLLS